MDEKAPPCVSTFNSRAYDGQFCEKLASIEMKTFSQCAETSKIDAHTWCPIVISYYKSETTYNYHAQAHIQIDTQSKHCHTDEPTVYGLIIICISNHIYLHKLHAHSLALHPFARHTHSMRTHTHTHKIHLPRCGFQLSVSQSQ